MNPTQFLRGASLGAATLLSFMAAAQQPGAGGDFYYYQGEPVPLERSATDLVVRFRGVTDAAARQEAVGTTMQVADEIRTEGRAFHIVKVAGTAANQLALSQGIDRLRASEKVEFVAHVFRHTASGATLLPTDEIVVKLRPAGSKKELADFAATLGLSVEKAMWGTTDEFVLKLDDPRGDALAKARALYESHRFAWAEPNFIREYKKFSTPNDPLFGQQWHLSNTGQSGGTPGADVKAAPAWDVESGNPNITIAIVDDGADLTHEDLAGNLFVNPGEIPGNGIDDDHNGYVDDVNGWDFSNNDNNPSHASANDGHGTSVSGVAAARTNNGIGVAGMCPNCKFLPVKIFSHNYAGDTATANAIRYAASFADVMNNSWGGGPASATLQSAILTAVGTGRGGKGTVTLFAAGNSASADQFIYFYGVPAGTHRIRISYNKDASISQGDDTAWLSWVQFPDGSMTTFESGSLPAGWTTGGNAPWTVVNDPRHADESLCLTHAAKAGTIGNSQTSWLETVKTLPAGNLFAFAWVSCQQDYDELVVQVDLDNNGTWDYVFPISGVPFYNSGVAYPAAQTGSIAVGASSNNDCRSFYSQFGSQLAFVAPSSAGPLNLGIETTDRSGAGGYDLSNYTSDFGGTSSATPLASGIAALLLSRNPSLTVDQVKAAMQDTADKVGPEPYISGRNDRYGTGRLNAFQALTSVTPCAMVTLSPTVLPNGNAQTAYSQNVVAAGGAGGYSYAAGTGSLPPGMTLSAAGQLSGTPTTAGTYAFSVQATDANGCTGYRLFYLAIGAAPPTPRSLYVITPCRVIDTRDSSALANLGTRDVQITGTCGIPNGASAVVANITAVSPATTGFLALYPTGTTWPGNSTMNYRAAKTRANNAVLTLSAGGAVTVLNNGATQHFIIDVTGYFQ